ncbi:uncharacterized protein C8orf74 homolog [Thalassophryne amazonica]|uniref:uncharacterized protein C8orf74 homolog n=1 Tax=Thalassophryne amazonica TaxID=390379 RepID=UPI001471A0BD|nr:uncharacterized protein C8orf74 homolog [Thalassophryne amazonica]
MDSLTESEISEIAKLERAAGVQRLGCHFSWPEFSDERTDLHQEFVYDVAMFAADQGYPWPNVIRAAVVAKVIFLGMNGLDPLSLMSLVKDSLSGCFQNLTPSQQKDFAKYFLDTCVARQQLFQAVVSGAANVTVTQLHLEVRLPPRLVPLSQGVELHEWEQRRHQYDLAAALRQKEEELKRIRQGSRVTLGEIDVPKSEGLDKEGVLEAVRAAVRVAGGQVQASLDLEASLVSDIIRLKAQQAAQTTTAPQSSDLSDDSYVTATKTKQDKARPAKTRGKESAHAL